MNILKSQSFSDARKLTVFVNKNNITKENIVIITCGTTSLTQSEDFTIFFYGDDSVNEEMPGFFD